MSKIAIYIEVEDGDEYEDLNHQMGITNEAYERIVGSEDHPPLLSWLGEVQDVKAVPF